MKGSSAYDGSVRLGDVCSLRSEAVHPSSCPDARYVGLEHLDSGNPQLRRWGEPSEVSSAKNRFHPGDVLYGKLRPYLDKAALPACPGICSTDILVLAPSDRLDAAFLAALVHSHAFLDRAIRTTKGVNHPRTSWASLASFEFRLPPLPEQRAIARALRAVQEAKEARRREAELERERKAALMAHLFTRGTRGEARGETELGELPETWRIVRLGDVVRTASGGTPDRTNPAYWGGDVPWVKTGEINYNTITDTEERITQTGLDNSSAKLLPAGTLLMAMFGQGVTRGRVAMLGIDATVNQACMAMIPCAVVEAGYLFHYLTYSYERIRVFGHGANQKNLNSSIIKSILLALPDLAEQREIADCLTKANAVDAARMRESSSLDELFPRHAEELMTGGYLQLH